MKTLTIIQIFRDKRGHIVKYAIQDDFGVIENIHAKDLKNLVKSGTITLKNFKLTSDNRLIQIKSTKASTQNCMSNNKYILLNKDKIVAYIDTTFETHRVSGELPYEYDNARDWIASRAKFSCARNVKEFFKDIGINNTNDFIHITHCVSLRDTFWIKDTSSKLTWNNVSPFRNDYSKIVSTYALEGTLTGKDKNYFSPVISTDGTFPHTWKFNGGDIRFIKASSKYTLGGSNSGREPFSEYYASVISEFLGFRHISYDIRNHTRVDGRIDVVTECKCYTSERYGSVTAHSLGLKSYEDVIECCKKLGDKSFTTILDMLFLDCLLLNTDRHFSNIEFFIDNDNMQVIEIVPIFDNNYSMVPRFMEGYDTFKREEYIARDNRTFEELYMLVTKYKHYTKELVKLKDLVLGKPKRVDINTKRLIFLNKFLQMQVKYLLSL